MSDVSPAELDGRPTEGKVLASQIAEAAAKRPKSKNLKPLSRLGPIAWRYRGDVFAAIGFLVISTGSTLGLTGALRLLIDYGFSPQNAAALNQSFLVVGGVALLLGFATALRYFFVTKVGERIVADLRKQVYANILKLDAAFFMHTRTGEVLSRLTTDIQIVETLTTTSVSLALRNSLSVIGALIAMFIVDAKLTGWVLLVFPVVLAPLFGYGRRVGKLTATTQDRFAEAVGVASESLDALETVQAFGRETASATRFAEAVEMAFGTSVQRIRARALMTALLITLVFGGITFVLWLGAQAVIHKEMTAGTLVQFVALSIFAAGAMANLGEAWGDVQKAAGAMQRIDELLRAEPKIKAPAAPLALPSPARGEIAFEDVVFAYPGRDDRPALQGLSFRVAPGETVALVGPSGGGKSTVFRLLLRFYDPVAGVVRLDGVDLTAADPADVRSRIALVAQDAALFSGSAAENIRYGREDASLAEIEHAAARAQAGGFIAALPQGYDTRLGERAKSLSGGQKQRLAIARALVRDAPVLLLDEATSALDAENERLVQQALDEAVKGRTTLVIAHRLATVLRADRILVLDQGRVVEQGAHASLVAAGGLYARLAELQFDGGGGA